MNKYSVSALLFLIIIAPCLSKANSSSQTTIIKNFSRKNINITIPATKSFISPFAVKAITDKEDIYQITYEDLNDLGIDLSETTNENLKIENQGNEIAVFRSGTGKFDPGDYLVFYATAFKSLYSKKNVYWIYQGNSSGKRMEEINGSPIHRYSEQAVFKNIYHAEEDRDWNISLPPWNEPDKWVWEKLSIVDPPLSKDFPVYLHNIDKFSGDYFMRVNLSARTDTDENPDHHTKIYVNHNMVADFYWDGRVDIVQEINDIPPHYFKEGENSITVEADNDTGALVDSYYLDWFEIECWNRFVADNNSLKFCSDVTGGATFKIDGFVDDSIMAFDTTNPLNIQHVTDGVITQRNSVFMLHFDSTGTDNRTFWTINSQSIKTPSEIIVDEPSSLSIQRDAVDYVIITHENFYERIQELKVYRESKGLNVEVAKIQDVYDEFSYGIKDAEAIRSFLSYAYNNWHSTDHPTYVLLVGDATVDFRDDMGYYDLGREDLVPTFLTDTGKPADSRFACVADGDNLPDMIIGRLCVKTDEDLKNIIEKIKKYETGKLAPWCGNVVFATDEEAVFEGMSENLAALMPLGHTTAKRVFLRDFDDVDSATDNLLDKINAGAVITNYSGHGNLDYWSNKRMFRTPTENSEDDEGRNPERNDVERLTNNGKLTVVMALTCLNGFFINIKDGYSLAEEFVRSQNKGAVACIAPAHIGYASEHQVFAGNFFDNFFNNKTKTIGSLFFSAKMNAYKETSSQDIVDYFTLFGDPATELKLITDSSTGSLALSAPEDNETLAAVPSPEFTWNKGVYEKFKVQFSVDPAFSPDTTITAPLLNKKYLYSEIYTPNFLVWSILKIMSSKNGKIFWRVLPVDESFDLTDRYSGYRSFSIQE